MTNTHYVEPTGLSIHNVSTARDLTKLLIATKQYPLIGQLSTTTERMASFKDPNYTLPFRNTNHLVYNPKWNIQLTKTGFTNQAGHCLAMRTVIGNRSVSLVVLDAFGKYTHFADANRLRSWIETGKVTPIPAAARDYRRQKTPAWRKTPPNDPPGGLLVCSRPLSALGPPDDKSPLAIAVETRFEVKLVRAGALLPRQQHHLVTALAPGQLQRVFDHRERHAVAAIGLCRHHVFDDAERLCLVRQPRISASMQVAIGCSSSAATTRRIAGSSSRRCRVRRASSVRSGASCGRSSRYRANRPLRSSGCARR